MLPAKLRDARHRAADRLSGKSVEERFPGPSHVRRAPAAAVDHVCHPARLTIRAAPLLLVRLEWAPAARARRGESPDQATPLLTKAKSASPRRLPLERSQPQFDR